MIEARALVKRYRRALAVDGVSFTAQAGRITALLGGSGAGKTTVLRILLGLERPTSGQALIEGQRYRDLQCPLSRVGAVLDARWVYRHRSARTHLRWLAISGGISLKRVDTALNQVDLMFAADDHINSFSDGMLRRLALAGALLGDPAVVIVDEPFGDQGAEDSALIGGVLATLASEGRTVLVSSGTAGEVALLADHLVIIDRGHLVTECSTDEFLSQAGGDVLRILSPRIRKLDEELRSHGVEARWETDWQFGRQPTRIPTLVVRADARRAVGRIAARHEVVLSDVATASGSLEEALARVIDNASDRVLHDCTACDRITGAE